MEGAPQYTPPSDPPWYHAPHASSRVLNIALTAGDQVDIQVDMSVADRLSGGITIVHSNVEAANRRILLHDLGPKFVQQLIDRASLRLEQVEEVAACRLGMTSVCSAVTGWLSCMRVRERSKPRCGRLATRRRYSLIAEH